MKITQTLTAMALTAFAASAHAETSNVTFTTGVDYSSGKYGGTANTNMTYIPVIAKYESGPVVFKLTVPYLRITGPSGGTVVTVGAGGTLIRQSVGPTTTTSGMGDIIAGLSYSVLNDAKSGTVVDITGKIKFGTASATNGLGTGMNDYAIQGDFYKTIEKFSAFATLGYRIMGKPAGFVLNDVTYGTVGGAYKFSHETSGGVTIDTRQTSSPNGTGQLEMTAYVTHKIEGGYKVQTYVMKGFSIASPDYGIGVMGSVSF